jgi:hypothetical protein
MIYELMQSIQGDATDNVHSLDYFYLQIRKAKAGNYIFIQLN